MITPATGVPTAYPCCSHCVDDFIHDVEPDQHTLPCDFCERTTMPRPEDVHAEMYPDHPLHSEVPSEVPIAVRIATIQVVLPYRGEGDQDSLSEIVGRLVDTEDTGLLDWRLVKIGGQFLSPTTTLGLVRGSDGSYIEGSAFRE